MKTSTQNKLLHNGIIEIFSDSGNFTIYFNEEDTKKDVSEKLKTLSQYVKLLDKDFKLKFHGGA